MYRVIEYNCKYESRLLFLRQYQGKSIQIGRCTYFFYRVHAHIHSNKEGVWQSKICKIC